MNILITGAGGQLGRDCLRVMRDEYKYTVHGRTSHQLNITQAQQVQYAIETLRPDVIINCAAYTAVDNCEKEQDVCQAVNKQGPANLADACAATGCRLIHISTDYVFDGNKSVPEPYLEQDQVSPLSAYGRSKLAGEQAITERMDNFLILRTAWLYGMGGNNFLKTMLRLATANSEYSEGSKRTIRVVDDQYGSMTWTMTLARQINRVLASDLTGIAHATAENHSTWYTGAKYFLKAMEVEYSLEPCTTAEYPTPAHRPTNSILENSFLKEHGVHCMRDWRADIDTFVASYKNELLAGR
jgi:dTDP-4-dehydrorhamnose reductase